jgi:hypothetical protein
VAGGRFGFLTRRALEDAAEGDKVAGQTVQNAQLGAEGFVVPAIPPGKECGVAHDQHGGHVFSEFAAGSGVPWAGIDSEVAGLFEQIEACLPFEESTVAPFMEVLFADGLTGKVAGQHGLDIGCGIEPIEEGAAVLVMGEAAVEFVAQGARQTGDFSFAKHNYLFYYYSL